MTLHLLGRTHLVQDGRPLPLSRKALGLLAYLALEGGAHHREELADLLWEGPGGLLNLRVELTRLRALGLGLFPARQVMLSAQVPTDLDGWRSASGAPDALAEALPTAWLQGLRGPPLGGLEDLGSTRYRMWVDHQRLRVAALLEERCAELEAGLMRRGQAAAAERVRRAAEGAGLLLPPGPARAGGPSGLSGGGDWPAQEAEVCALLRRAHEAPQCLLLWGQRGSARALLRDALHATASRLVQVQYTPHASHLLHALVQQVGGPAAPPGPPATDDAPLLRLAALLAAQEVPLVVALHDVCEVPSWLADAVGLLLELRVPLLLVLAPTASAHDGLPLSNVDWSRVHELTLPGLGSAEVRRRLAAATPAPAEPELQSRASEIAQLTEGWPLYVEALLGAPQLSPHLPEALGARIRGQLAHLPPATRGGLCQLAQLQDQFTLPVAHALLGDQADDVLQAARRLGVIGPAAPWEDVALATLSCVHDDAESRLAFGSEVVRVALAAGLPPSERQAVRARLAALLCDTSPALALYYAERVRHPELIARARAALPPGTPLRWQRVAPLACSSVRAAPGAAPGRALHTPNGYRVAWQGGPLELLRRGWPAPPPQLNLCLGTVGPGPWRVQVRLDVFRPGPPMMLCAPPYALGVQVGAGPAQRFAPEPTAACAGPREPAAEYHAGLPLGQEVSLGGHWAGPPGPLVLSVRAVDLALQIASVSWDGQDVLAPTVAGRAGAALRGTVGV